MNGPDWAFIGLVALIVMVTTVFIVLAATGVIDDSGGGQVCYPAGSVVICPDNGR